MYFSEWNWILFFLIQSITDSCFSLNNELEWRVEQWPCHPDSPFTFNDVCFYLHSTFVKNFQNLEIRQKESYMPFQCHLRAFYNISTQGSSHTLEEDNFVWLIIYYLIRAQIFKNWMPNCGRFICCKWFLLGRKDTSQLWFCCSVGY